VRLWIDTDIGDNPDDALALLCAVGHPGIELVGVSTVGAGADARDRAEIVRALLASVHAPVPLLYAGPPDPRALAAAEAIVAIGPLTNLAALVRRGVELPPTAVMGGVLHPPVLHRGAARRVDTNFAADPAATALIVHAVDDLLLVPLDVTAQLVLDDERADDLARNVPALADALRDWRARQRAPIALHDPATVLALCGEHVVVGKRHVQVASDGSIELRDAESGREVDVVIDAARDDMAQRVCELVNAATAPVEPTPSHQGD
jgi:inosine-uridine nucleoside N-ribohydrolase